MEEDAACRDLTELSAVALTICHDNDASLPPETRKCYTEGSLTTILYADDTLIVRRNAKQVEQLLRTIELAGNNFGLQLHADKFQLRESCAVHNSDGTEIKANFYHVFGGLNHE